MKDVRGERVQLVFFEFDVSAGVIERSNSIREIVGKDFDWHGRLSGGRVDNSSSTARRQQLGHESNPLHPKAKGLRQRKRWSPRESGGRLSLL